MIGWLIKRGLKKRLAELEADPLLKDDQGKRGEQAEIVRLLYDNEAAIPFFDAIARDFPADRRHAQTAAEMRFHQEDPDAPAALEALAVANPGMATWIYRLMIQHYFEAGTKAELERLLELAEAAEAAESLATYEGRLLDPGGPIGAFDVDAAAYNAIRAKLAGVKGLVGLLAGTRTLNHGGYRQHVMVYEMAPNGNAEKIHSALIEFIGDYGDTTAWPAEEPWLWLHAQLLAIPNSRVFP